MSPSPPFSALAVLMYHAVLADGASDEMLTRQDKYYALAAAEFREHLDIILASGWPIATIEDCCAIGATAPVASAKKGIAFTFDDSWSQHVRVAAPALLARGLPAVFFLTAGELGRLYRLANNDVRQLAQLGFAIGSHGMSHRFLTLLPDEELDAELADSRKQLEDCLGKAVRWLSLPGGRGNRRVLERAAAAGYEAVFGSRPDLWQPHAAGKRARVSSPIVPRICMRPGQKGKSLLTLLLQKPEITVKRLQRGDLWRRLVRFVLGDRLYHALHSMLAGSRR